MRRKMTRLTCVFIALTLSLSSFAQKGFIKGGDNAFKNKEYFSAIEMYKKAYSQNPPKADKARLIFQLGECYRMIGDTKEEIQWYNKAIKANYDDATAYLYLGDAQMQAGNYDEALASYKQYKEKVPSDPRGDNGIKSCEKAQELKTNPTRYVVTNIGSLNTKSLDFSPAYSDRRLDELIFTSTRQGTTGDEVDNGLGQNTSDLFITKLDKNGKFSAPVPLPAPVNTGANEGSATFDKTFRTMYFTRCNIVKSKGERCHIYSSDRRGNAWTDPVMLAFQIDTVTYGHPSITGDGQTLFYSSDLTGGMGGHDIWLSHYDKKTKSWGTPINAGSGVNTPGEELYPFINPDGSLYFSSNGWPGMGGLDIFHATSTGTDKWGNAENMGSPINSEADDFGIVFEGTKNRGYLSSNRTGGKGLDDIYSFYLPPILYVIEGTVYDVDTHKGIKGATVRMVGSDGSDVSLKTDTGGHYRYGANGATNRYVNANSSYILSADALDLLYLASDEKANETTVGVNESRTFIHNFQLKKPTEVMHFPEVLYGLDSANLKPQSKDSLNYLVKLLNNNPTLAIELDAHTDQQGELKHNMILSDARAKSCVTYLISQGIDSARLTSKGFGPTKLLIKDAQINAAKTKRAKDSLYQINRRTVFQITSWKYVPKGHVMTKMDSLKMKAGMQKKVSGQEIDDSASAPVPEEERLNEPTPPVKGGQTPNKQTPQNSTTPKKPNQD